MLQQRKATCYVQGLWPHNARSALMQVLLMGPLATSCRQVHLIIQLLRCVVLQSACFSHRLIR
jgi:hypothetical protein